jgi:RNA polymerase sigma-70 factor (ECF subfamily)
MSSRTHETEEEEDRDLVARFLARRDEPSFSALYARHAGGVFALGSRLSGSASEAEDLLQEVWIRAAEGLGGFRWESSLRTWLCGILVRRWKEVCRARARRPQTVGLAGETGDGWVEGNPAGRLDLEAAVRALPDGYREVVLLHDVNGYTHAEIAALLQIEEGTSKSQLARGRERLRDLLGDRKKKRTS